MRELASRVDARNRAEQPIPSHHDWPAELKAWLVYQLVVARMDLYRSKQVPWEQLLRAAFVSRGGGKAAPGPDGKHWAMNGPLDDMLVAASKLAADWQSSDSHHRFINLLTGSTNDE